MKKLTKEIIKEASKKAAKNSKEKMKEWNEVQLLDWQLRMTMANSAAKFIPLKGGK